MMREDQSRKMAIEEPGWEGCHDLEIEKMPYGPEWSQRVTGTVCRRRERHTHSGT